MCYFLSLTGTFSLVRDSDKCLPDSSIYFVVAIRPVISQLKTQQLHMKTTENGKNQWKSIVCMSKEFEQFVVVAASFSKVCTFSKNNLSTPQQCYYDNIIFQSFLLGDSFQKL